MRWSWHEKLGPRNGPIIRHSDRMTPAQEEAKERDRHKREHDYIISQRHPEHLYETTRICGWCGKEEEQRDMLWTNDKWMCVGCQAPPKMRPHSEWLLDKPKPT